MAIDTVTLRSPFISENLAHCIENQSIRRQGWSMESGEILYSLTTAKLQGSYDSRISVKIERMQKGFENNKPYNKPCQPFITLECSVHKAMVGHNVYGGTEDFKASVRWLIDLVSELLNLELPRAEEWEVRRIDVAEVFELPAKEAIFEWFNGLQIDTVSNSHNVHRYGTHGVHVNKTAICLKFYHKGTEFKKHDAKRISRFLSYHTQALQDKADKILRVEVELKSRKLKQDFGFYPMVDDISKDYLRKAYNEQIKGFLKETGNNKDLVRTISNVQDRLWQMYGKKRSISLFSTWYQMATLGEAFVKKSLKQSTFYEHVRLLKKAGCSWHNAKPNSNRMMPESFTPIRDNKYRLDKEIHVITQKLNKYRFSYNSISDEESII